MTEADLKFALVALSAVFFVIDPLANVPIFLTITANDTPAQRCRTARRAAFATWVILCVFALAGGLIFQAFGISLGAFKVAGGLMLLLMAVDMMRAQPSPTRTSPEEQAEGVARDDVAIFPMAIPMLAGPGAIATVMVLMTRHREWTFAIPVFVAIALTAGATYALLRTAVALQKRLSNTALNVMMRVMGLILAAIAVEFVVAGAHDVWPLIAGAVKPGV
jgi:multiple antibiotic resistance protein